MASKQEEQIYREWVAQIQYFQKMMEELENNLQGIERLKQDIQELQNFKGDEDILAPVANGIFIEAKLKNKDKLKVNVGNGVVVEKSITETIHLLEKQEEEIRKTITQVDAKLSELYNDAEKA